MAGRTKRDLRERPHIDNRQKRARSPPNRKPSKEQNKVKTTLEPLWKKCPDCIKLWIESKNKHTRISSGKIFRFQRK